MKQLTLRHRALLFFIPLLLLANNAVAAVAQFPLFLTAGVPPVVMLTMGRDHKLYYEAYNDASDLNNDGELDFHYKPSTIDYFGYFDSYKCYSYASGKFSPVSVTANKQCSGNWSGDFLNYITTSRIDALRKVLYGGYRSTDSTTETILKRSFIPQDAHSWGKEYNSVAIDGYDISNYTPLALPTTGTRHLFANVSLSDSGQPLMRVLNDSVHRIWEWVSIERPVAGTQCNNSSGSRVNCATTSTSATTVPSTLLKNLVRTTYDKTGYGNPSNHSEFETLVTTYGIPAKEFGNGAMTTIKGNDNPYGSNDNYLTVVTGQINVPTSGTYEFAVDGDDAVEVIIDGTVVAGWYGGHGDCNCSTHSGTISLTANTDYSIEFRHEESTGGDSFELLLKTPSSTMVDYEVNVEACVTGLLEANCKGYSDGTTTTYKPTGILQRYGEDDLMAFGLLSGSFQKNTSGGVLRKNIASFKDEVDLNTGIFTNVTGIVDTIDKLRITRFNYSDHAYTSGWITNGPITEGQAQDWGNPVAEMMYEGLRYFAGKATPTSDFATSTGGTLNLPIPSWQDPYRTTSGGYASCAKPIQMVISDVNTSYDSDQLPGSYFSSFTGDLTGMNVSTLADTIWAGESEASNIFIGQSGTVVDGSPSPKTVTSFSNIRGLAPEEPTKLGSYYAGSIGLYGQKTDMNSVTGEQNVDTLSVALASPLPRIEIPVAGKLVTLVPFAKSVNRGTATFQPTNQIVDFYVENIVNTGAGNTDNTINSGRPYGKFRINYEDVEQAADHDMDAIVEYEFLVNASNQIIVTLNSTYAAGGIIQHMGYVISGTTADGTYLEVRDVDTNAGSDPDYILDTPPGQLPGGVWNDGSALPLTATRTFNVGSTTSASFIKHDPLWYAAKWSMADADNNGTLDPSEWDSDSDGNPDGYFLVTNAGTLDAQLSKAFEEIVSRTSSSAAVATNSTRLDTNTKVYQARFNSSEWIGQLLAFNLNSSDGSVGSQAWDAATKIPSEGSRKIYSYNPAATGSKGIIFEYANLDPTTQQVVINKDTSGVTDTLGADRIDYIRGDQSKELSNGGAFRDRSSLMGDIINSDPWFVGRTEDFGYSSLSGTEGSSYASFRNSKLSRTPALYFGANDGMLHGINADTGVELFTYVPDTLLSKLNLLPSPLYGCTGQSGCLSHSYFVDGAPKAGDAYINTSGSNAWHSILLGTTGAGGKGLFALDVTTPSTFSASDILWEISTTQSPVASDLSDFQSDLGYTIPQPSVVKMQNGKWVAIVANGYESTSKTAVLFIIDLETGEIIKKISTGVGSGVAPNGLSSPIPVDEDSDRIVDSIYAGDLQGNLWKFDVSASNPNSWGVAFKSGSTPLPLYVAKDSNDVVQPITAKPQVGFHPDGGLMVYFGTGKFFEDGDQDVTGTLQTQTFYGIRDQGAVVSSRSDLQQQTILHEETISTLSLDVRVTSDTTVTYPTQKGWYMDLVSPVNGAEGERVVSTPVIRSGRIIFATMIPESDPCGWGGSSWLMELDAVNGNRLATSPFDINEDGTFDINDLLASYDTNHDGVIDAQDQVEISGVRKHGVGIIKTPGIVSTGNDTEVKYVSGSSGSLEIFKESAGDPFGRQSWRQLR
jgi:type IV pilus assembly protein PilY1